MTSRTRSVIALLGAVAGSILFTYSIQRAGIQDIADGIRRVGWGLLLVLLLSGLRFIIRAECWRLCLPASTPLPRSQAVSAFLAGDAVGSVTPLGLLASEPTKVLLTRRHLVTRESVASLAVENLVYAASVVAMLALGIAVLLATVSLPSTWRVAGALALILLLSAGALAAKLLRGTWDPARGVRPRWRERLAGIRVLALGFSPDQHVRLWRAFFLDLVFHGAAVLEVYFTLGWLAGAGSTTLAQAVVFEALNRVVTVAFKFVPFRIGVDEAISGALAPVMSLDPATGVALAVVRKIRSLAWTGIGLAIVAAHPARSSARGPAGPVTDRPGNAPVHRL